MEKFQYGKIQRENTERDREYSKEVSLARGLN